VAMDHVVERMMHGEIVQMKRERLIRITRCHVVESVMSQYCGWQSRAGVVRYLKFREPYTVEPSACRHANKTGMIMINKKSWPVQMGAVRSYADYLEGSLDLGHNCPVGTHMHGGVVIDRQVTQSILEVSVRMEWARVNEVSGMITTTSGLIAPVTDRSMMDTQDGTYVWEYFQEDCPDSIVQLYLGSIKVLSNSSTSYVGGLAIVEGSKKDQEAGLELTESFLLCSAHPHQEYSDLLSPHVGDTGCVRQVQHRDGGGGGHPPRVGGQLLAGEGHHVAEGAHKTSQGRNL
jgi:hypothetical protein